MTRLILTGDVIPVDPERVKHLARSMVALGEGRPTEEVMAALELAVGSLVREAWNHRSQRVQVLGQFHQNARGYALK
jgi:hypothetical protein